MNENDARRTLLVRAFETAAPSPQWDDEDREWATRSAAQVEGEKSTADRFVARRADLAAERLAQRIPAVARTLAMLQWRPWIVGALALAAFVVGLLVDTLGAGNRINILAPPILAILVWNLAVYAALAIGAIRRRLADRRRGATVVPPERTGADAAPGLTARQAGTAPAGWLARWLAARLAGLPHRARRDGAADRSPIAAFLRHWSVASSALYGSRGLCALHLAAAGVGAGLVASLYLRGLAFEFLAGWQSTFLTAGSVRTLLGTVLGPASALTGIALPDIAGLEAIRQPLHAGENAANWIHLYAVTVLLGVIVPRLVLAALDGWRARRLAADFPVPLAEPYFLDLLRQYRGEAAVVQVLPYSYQAPVETVRALGRLMQALYGPATQVTVVPSVQLGGEDRLRDNVRPQAGATLTIALFTLIATPEEENHAAFVRALREALPDGAPLLVLVDESSFQARFGAGSERLTTRRAAWRRILATGPDIEPVFLALGSDEPSQVKQHLLDVLHLNATRMVQNYGLTADARAPA